MISMKNAVPHRLGGVCIWRKGLCFPLHFPMIIYDRLSKFAVLTKI